MARQAVVGAVLSGRAIPRRALDTALVVGLVALVLFLYAPTFDDEWHFDDRAELEWPGVREFAPEVQAHGYRGVVVLWTWALNYRWSGEDPWSYHVVNVGLHALATLGVFAIAAMLGRRRLFAATAAALFAAHPLASQTVAYVTQRSTSLAALAIVGSLLGALVFRAGGRSRALRLVGLGLGIVTFGVGLHTKHVVLIVPAILLALEGWRLTGRAGSPGNAGEAEAPAATTATAKRRFAWMIPWFLLAALRLVDYVPLLTRRLLPPADPAVDSAAGAVLPLAGAVSDSVGALPYLWTQCRVVPGYIGSFLLPRGQTIDPDIALAASPFEPGVLAGAGFLLALALGAILARRRLPLISFGVVFMLVSFLPTSSVIPSPDLAFEHRAYVPSIGFALAAAAVIGAWGRRLGRATGLGPNRGAAALAAIAVVALAGATRARVPVWDTELTLWRNAAAQAPRKVRPRVNLALALQTAGHTPEAERHYEEILRLHPDEPLSHNNLGNILRARGDTAEAIRHYEAALAADRDYLEPRVNLGNTALDRRAPDEAEAWYREVVTIDPGHFAAWYNLAKVAEGRGDWEAAVDAYRRAIESRPRDARAINDLGCVRLQQGRRDEAIVELRRAIDVSGGWEVARYNLSLALEAAGDEKGAIEELEAALEHAPAFEAAADRLARLRRAARP